MKIKTLKNYDIFINEYHQQQREDADYKNAYIKVLSVLEINVDPYLMFNALSFVKDNKLAIYKNFYSASLYLENAILDYYEGIAIENLNAKDLKHFKNYIKQGGLLDIIGKQLLQDANKFLNEDLDKEIDLNYFFALKNDYQSLIIENITDKETLKEIFKEIDKELYQNSQGYQAFKCLINLIERG